MGSNPISGWVHFVHWGFLRSPLLSVHAPVLVMDFCLFSISKFCCFSDALQYTSFLKYFEVLLCFPIYFISEMYWCFQAIHLILTSIVGGYFYSFENFIPFQRFFNIFHLWNILVFSTSLWYILFSTFFFQVLHGFSIEWPLCYSAHCLVPWLGTGLQHQEQNSKLHPLVPFWFSN